MRVDQNGPEREGRLLAPAHFVRRHRQTIDYLLDLPAVSVQNRIGGLGESAGTAPLILGCDL